MAAGRSWGLGLAALLALLPDSAGAQGPPVVRASGRSYVGVKEADSVSGFRGIAYARPPLGPLRWKPPQPLRARKGRVDATRIAAACPQGEGNTRWYRRVAGAMGADPARVPGIARISEDCLYLNIWTTSAQPERLPVMVWIHGGSNENGYPHEPNYLGTRLAGQGVVVVSVGYRLGLLGFFAHPVLGADGSGDQGLRDQIAALRWVQANIAAFGGDPRRVTVFGESAGGSDIAMLAAQPEAGTLFARAIIQSGYLAPDAAATPQAARRISAGLFAPKITSAALRAMPWQEIVNLQDQRLRGHFHTPVAPWPRPVRVPLLIGSNADEYRMYLPADEAGLVATLADEVKGLPARQVAQIEALIPEAGSSLASRVDAVSSGKAFHCPAARMADRVASAGRPVFVYRFGRARPGGHGLGAYHGAEIPYVFGTADSWLPGTDEDDALARQMQAYWVNFARTGDPNGPGLPLWPRWTGAAPKLLALGDRIEPRPMPLASLCPLLAPPAARQQPRHK